LGLPEYAVIEDSLLRLMPQLKNWNMTLPATAKKHFSKKKKIKSNHKKMPI